MLGSIPQSNVKALLAYVRDSGLEALTSLDYIDKQLRLQETQGKSDTIL
jgi:hypothetical protein